MMRSRRPWMVGIRWGIGHAGGVILVGAIAYFFRELLTSHVLMSWSERLVGIALIAIGLWGVRKSLSQRVHTHEHTHEGQSHLHIHLHAPETAHPAAKPKAHFHTHTAFAVGTLHGLAGSSHFLGVLPTLGMPTPLDAAMYLLAFGIGTIVAMASFSSLMDLVARCSSFHGVKAYRFVTTSFSLAAIVVGCFWFWRA